jgi:hypothetical protein
MAGAENSSQGSLLTFKWKDAIQDQTRIFE